MTLDAIPKSVNGRSALQVARMAAREAGDLLLRRFGNVRDVRFKGPGNPVTDVDLAAERLIEERLRSEYPGMAVLGEESPGLPYDDGYVWIVDPLDGTRNYACGVPHFSVVIGLALDGRALVGVNYDPVRDEMFEAELGGGAFLNRQPIAVSEKSSMSEAIVGTDLSYDGGGAANGLDVIRGMWPGFQTARVMGSAALGIAYTAAGRHDLYFHHRLEPWDQVAGILLVREAGGVVTDRNGAPAGLDSDGLIAANARLHEEFLRLTDGMAWREPTGRVSKRPT